MDKNNNFDFLRFLFALLVVISHSYPLSGSNENEQWIYKITNGQVVLASIGLNGFFIISGFFIFQSLGRSKSLSDYYRKRFLRIFPGLFIVLLLSVLLAPFVYESTIRLYDNIDLYTYLPNNLSLYHFQSCIKGIFDSNSFHAINGSLWTIRYEFTLYVLLSLLFVFRKNIRIVQLLLLVSFVILYLGYSFFMNRLGGSNLFGIQGYNFLNLGTFFIFGSFLSSIHIEQLQHKRVVAVVFLVILVLSVFFNFYDAVKHIVLPILILLIGLIPVSYLSSFGRIGDMSYGIYIYSFPIQQTVVYFYKFNKNELIVSSVILSIIFGYLSWHLIEKRALKFKGSFNLKNHGI